MIGEIKSPGRPSGKPGSPVVSVRGQPAVIEALRILWTNLEFASVDRPLRTLLVASPGPDEGKTTIAVNLASAMAQSGKRVALIDADLRRPAVHSSFDVPAQPGLSDVFLGRKQTADIVTPRNGGNLLVIPAGTPPPNPTELLSSRRMDEILTEVRALADIVLIDAPPFGLADASVLASKADGVIVIVRPGTTSRNGARAMQAQLERAGASVLGMVLNRASRSHVESLGGYGDYLRDQGGGDQGGKDAGSSPPGGTGPGDRPGGPWISEVLPAPDAPAR